MSTLEFRLEQTMAEVKLNQTHKDLLQYFSSMILDPEGHKKWMQEIRDKTGLPRSN